MKAVLGEDGKPACDESEDRENGAAMKAVLGEDGKSSGTITLTGGGNLPQ